VKATTPFAELILFNGRFYTLDDEIPRAQAVAIKNGRIVAIGDNAEVTAMAARGTVKIDLGERTVLPGLIDSHFHFYTWAVGLRELELSRADSLRALLDQVTHAAAQRPAGEWIIGQGWNEADWPQAIMPTRDQLDAAAPDHPVALWRCDLHLAVVNSAAMQRAGIDRHTPDPPDGQFERAPSGRLTGILRELASNRIKAVIPEPDDGEVVEWMQKGVARLHKFGLTGVHDIRLMGGLEGPAALRAWQILNERGELELRCWVSLPGEQLEQMAALGLRSGLGDDRLRIGHLKYFADGGMGARTAWVLEPYHDADLGMPLIPMDQLARRIRQAERAGLAVIVHAIGDRANRETITIFEDLQKKRRNGDSDGVAPPALPHRIEHAQFIRSEDIERLARLKMAVSVQPHNMILDMNMIDACVGDRARWAYPYQEMLAAGVPLILSSDAPVCDPSPWVGIHAAVTRQRKDGTPAGGWYPQHRISVESAVQGYTTAPAAFYGRSQELGSVSLGKFADLVVLDRDIFRVDPMAIAETTVLMTLFNGRVVFRHASMD
jgi:predicted amidohydrolase YtcJ